MDLSSEHREPPLKTTKIGRMYVYSEKREEERESVREKKKKREAKRERREENCTVIAHVAHVAREMHLEFQPRSQCRRDGLVFPNARARWPRRETRFVTQSGETVHPLTLTNEPAPPARTLSAREIACTDALGRSPKFAKTILDQLRDISARRRRSPTKFSAPSREAGGEEGITKSIGKLDPSERRST